MRGLDFSYAISSGNELDLDLADYINFLVDDEHTRIIVLLVEGIRRPQALMAAPAPVGQRVDRLLAAAGRGSFSLANLTFTGRPTSAAGLA